MCGNGFVLLNDLRLESGGKVAWLDHLIIHRFGIVLIESRTCALRTQCDGGLWFRQDEGAWREVPSPTQRLERDANMLRGMLAQAESFLFERQRQVVKRLRVDAYVSVAKGVTFAPEVTALASVVRAEELSEVLHARLLTYVEREWLAPLGEEIKLEQGEIERTGRFLLAQHRGLSAEVKFSEAGLEAYFNLDAQHTH